MQNTATAEIHKNDNATCNMNSASVLNPQSSILWNHLSLLNLCGNPRLLSNEFGVIEFVDELGKVVR